MLLQSLTTTIMAQEPNLLSRHGYARSRARHVDVGRIGSLRPCIPSVGLADGGSANAEARLYPTAGECASIHGSSRRTTSLGYRWDRNNISAFRLVGRVIGFREVKPNPADRRLPGIFVGHEPTLLSRDDHARARAGHADAGRVCGCCARFWLDSREKEP